MADYTTRDGYAFDDTANPAINTPTLARQMGQALDNTRFLQQVKCDILSGRTFFGADRDGGFSLFLTGYLTSATGTFETPGWSVPIADPSIHFGAGTTPGDLTTALKDRWCGLSIFTIDPGAVTDVFPGGGGEIELGTNGIHPARELLSFYTGTGIAGRGGDSNYRVETSFSTETLLFYVHSTTGALRMYWSGSSEIAWVIRADFSPKQNGV